MTMHPTIALRTSLAWWLAAILVLMAALAPSAAAAPAADAQAELVVYVRDGCPHCADAKVFLAELARQRPNLRVVLRPVDRDAAAREDLVRLSRDAGVWPPGVPTFVANGRLFVGFDSAERTGPAIVALIGPPATASPPGASALSGRLNADEMGLPLFTLAMGLLDGFNPCAMWVLLFLLSLLVRLQDRRRMALVAGTFVLASGAVYFAFMAAWLNVFLLVGMSAALRAGAGRRRGGDRRRQREGLLRVRPGRVAVHTRSGEARHLRAGAVGAQRRGAARVHGGGRGAGGRRELRRTAVHGRIPGDLHGGARRSINSNRGRATRTWRSTSSATSPTMR